MRGIHLFSFSPRSIWISLWERYPSGRGPFLWRHGIAWACLCLALCMSLPASAEELHIDLNRAGVSELCRLPGIGPKRAEAIIEMRRKKPFTRISQLLRVRGIGRKTLSRLRPLLYIDVLGQIQRASSHPLRSRSASDGTSMPASKGMELRSASAQPGSG